MKKKDILKKWSKLIDAAKSYYVDSLPTGLSDAEWDKMESQAIIEDNFRVRDYIWDKYFRHKKVDNHYITKFKKTKVLGRMIEAMEAYENTLGEKLYWTLKYDGTSIAVYLEPDTGDIKYIATCGNLNAENKGIDQTEKFRNFIPNLPKGLSAVQCEAVIDLRRLPKDYNPDRARQKANGLINALLETSRDEVNSFLVLVCYRYFTESPDNMDYRDKLNSFPMMLSSEDNHIMFTKAQVWTLDELKKLPDTYIDSISKPTESGVFLSDGWVAYNKNGVCVGGLKFAGAGSGDDVQITTVNNIKWNSLSQRGKDSWTANVEIDPIELNGSLIKKPSAGSVSKLVSKNITPGAKVSIILANSTIPMVGDVFSPGNGNFNWPKCECGYQLGSSDVYGSFLKCGNIYCTERIKRMTNYVNTLNNIVNELDLNKLLAIDRVKWENIQIDISKLLGFVASKDIDSYKKYLESFLTTELQKKTLELVYRASFTVLKNKYDLTGTFN